MSTATRRRVAGGIGTSPVRSDGVPKVTGNFAYTSDLHADGMLWGATVRSPHPHAEMVGLDVGPALAMSGVHAVLTHDDVPGTKMFGVEHADQPVLCDGTARYWGEPVAIIAADDSETARLAAAAVGVQWKVLPPVADPEAAAEAGASFRVVQMRRGDPEAHGDVVVEGFYETGMQDQAPLGTESGLAIPDGQGGVDLYCSSQWVHADHDQIVACLGVAGDQVRSHPAGMGGAFGAREDISMQIHLCLLALHTGRPVKLVYDRAESFVGHVHRHPARMWYRHEADDTGRLVRVDAEILLDGGAYASTSAAVVGNAAYFAVGPYKVDNVFAQGIAARTNNPPCGAMRGFGSVQACFGAESQMDRLAAALGIDPLELRRRNALQTGDRMSTTGQVITEPLPVRRVIDELAAMPLPEARIVDDARHLPGGTGLTTPASAVRRGVGYAMSLKNLAFSESFDDYAEVRVVVTEAGAEVHSAAVEVGQGMVTVCEQIVREVLGIEEVVFVFDDTSQIGSAGSTSASRQTQMTGGGTYQAALALKEKLFEDWQADSCDGDGLWRDGELVASWGEVCANGPLEQHVRFRHPPTEAPDENGQGNLHASFAVAAHRAVVDVDPDLGLVRVVHVATVQDVGRVLHPVAAVGQIEGGIMQGVGLAVMEELVLDEGKIRNASFTDYLLPTFLDAPDMVASFVEEPGTWGPFGAKGIGEPPTISSTPAVVAAISAAIGKELHRAPVRPQDIAL
ncbi:MAG: xanthine dehydrogenase family protein molybdopterin-binding subunit [Acidimicrobiia bacterium]